MVFEFCILVTWFVNLPLTAPELGLTERKFLTEFFFSWKQAIRAARSWKSKNVPKRSQRDLFVQKVSKYYFAIWGHFTCWPFCPPNTTANSGLVLGGCSGLGTVFSVQKFLGWKLLGISTPSPAQFHHKVLDHSILQLGCIVW